MAGFLDLADEIISEIFWYLPGYKHQITPISCLSRRLYLLLRPRLMRDITRRIPSAKAKHDLFLRTITENPELALMVHTFELYWSDSKDTNAIHNTANSILQKLVNLRSILIHTARDNNVFQPRFLEHNPLRLLSKVIIEDWNLTMTGIIRYASVEGVKFLSIYTVKDSVFPSFSSNKVSSVQHLHIAQNAHLSCSALERLLGWFKNLKSLTCGIPGREHCHEPDIGEDEEEIDTLLSPEAIAGSLLPVSHSLVELQLVRGKCVWPNHDGSRMDLSKMKLLERVRVPFGCFFQPTTKTLQQPGLYKLLPPSIESLEIVFSEDDGCGILYRLQNPKMHTNPESYASMTELVERKEDTIPRLRAVNLKEDMASGNTTSLGDIWGLSDWQVPPVLERSFDIGHVKLSGLVWSDE